MNKIDKANYMARIPDCCRLRTWKAHKDIMLCWGLVERERSECGRECAFHKEHDPELLKKILEADHD